MRRAIAAIAALHALQPVPAQKAGGPGFTLLGASSVYACEVLDAYY